MSLLGLILSVVGLLMFAMYQFMFVVFAGAGLANGNNLSKRKIAVLDACMYLVPSITVLTAGALIYFYTTDSNYLSYKWYLLPLATSATYFFFVMKKN